MVKVMGEVKGQGHSWPRIQPMHFLLTSQSSGPEMYCHTGLAERPGGWLPELICGMHISETTGQIFSIQSYVELSRPEIVQHHGHLPTGQKLVKSGTSGVQTFQNVYHWNHWTDLLHFKFYRII